MVLPAGTTVPPLPYLLLIAVMLAGVVYGVYRRDPWITDVTVMALAPWMVAGATMYVTYQLELVPGVVAPLASSPTVYVTATIVAGSTWMVADISAGDTNQILGATGVLLAIPPTIAALLAADQLTPLVPLASVLTTVMITIVYMALADAYATSLAATGYAGTLAVFGQTLDGLTTALGVAHLGFGEQTPLSRILIEATAAYPAPVLGAGWLFFLVKLSLGVGVVWLLAPTVEDRPREGHLLLALVAAVGLGPGAHNALLFTVTAP